MARLVTVFLLCGSKQHCMLEVKNHRKRSCSFHDFWAQICSKPLIHNLANFSIHTIVSYRIILARFVLSSFFGIRTRRAVRSFKRWSIIGCEPFDILSIEIFFVSIWAVCFELTDGKITWFAVCLWFGTIWDDGLVCGLVCDDAYGYLLYIILVSVAIIW